MIDVSMISLKSKVERDRDVFQQVARLWSIDPQEQNDDTTKKLLMDRVQNAHAARSVWEALSPEERVCLFHTFGSGNPERQKGITLESLRKKTKLSAPVLETAVSRLIHQWFLVDEGVIAPSKPSSAVPSAQRGIFPYRECFRQLWQTGQELFTSYADRSAYSLQHLISNFHGDQLHHLANLCHVQLSSGTPVFSYNASPSRSHPVEVQHRLYEALQHPLLAFELLHQVTPAAQGLFLWLCEQQGKARMSEVRSFLETPSEGHLLTLLDTLEAHALAFDSLSKAGERWLFVPHDLLALVKHEAHAQAEDERHYALYPLLQEDAPPPQEELPALLYDLATIVGMSMQEIIEPTKDERIPKRMHGKIRPLLHGRVRQGDSQDDLYVDQLFSAAKELGLLGCEAPSPEEKRHYVAGQKLHEWSKLSCVEQARQFLAWWTKASSWYDLRPDGRLIPSPSSAHERLLDQLKQCVPGRWYSVDGLLYAIWRQMPLFLYDSYRHTFTKATSLRSRRQEWIQREGETYIGLISSALSELGVVSLISLPDAPEREKNPSQLFCVTVFGGAVLGETGSPGEALRSVHAKPMLIVQPNYDVLVMQFEPHLIYQLTLFAKIERMGQISSFRFTQQALLRGLAQGLRIEHILAFLTKHTGYKNLPQNIEYTLREWVKSYRDAQLTEVILIETSHDLSEEDFVRLLKDMLCEARKVAPGVFAVVSTGATFGDLRRRLTQHGMVVRGQPSSFRRRSER